MKLLTNVNFIEQTQEGALVELTWTHFGSLVPIADRDSVERVLLRTAQDRARLEAEQQESAVLLSGGKPTNAETPADNKDNTDNV